jgi:serine protease AprX
MIIFGLILFPTFDSAYSKSTKGEDVKVNSFDESKMKAWMAHRDGDNNKVFDDLDEELEIASDKYQRDVLVMLDAPASQVGEKTTELKKVLGQFKVGDTYSVIPGFSAKLSKKQIMQLAALDITTQIEPDLKVEAFIDTATHWFGAKQARSHFSVNGDGDGNPSTYSKDDIVIAIIDTGIGVKHKDLNKGKVIGWKDFVKFKANAYDDNGHGTHVSSIAAGEGEANPLYVGVAPGAALVGVKVLDSTGSGTFSKVIKGINWVVNNKDNYGIEILNLSLGAAGCSDGTDSLSQAVNNAVAAGIIAVVAAGNRGPITCTIGSPAAAENAITVGAMADVKERGFYLASFSSRGPTQDGRIKPDVVAPGVAITAAKRGTFGVYITLSGTSMATPYVAGIAALMLDADMSDGTRNLTPSDVKSKIMSTAIDWGTSLIDVDYGAGRLDGYEAVRNAFDAPISALNIASPTHTTISGNLAVAGSFDTWTIDVNDISYPIAITMIMPEWGTTFPDFDMTLYNPSGTVVASSDAVIRQETILISVSTTGTYTLKVHAYAGSGSYVLDISSGS